MKKQSVGICNEAKAMKAEYFAVMLEGAQTPSVLHDSYEKAHSQAVELVSKTRKKGYILKAIAKVECNDVKITPM